jgi:hypothetical protein
MTETTTKTITKSVEFSITDLCDEEQIPYLYTIERPNSKGVKTPTLPKNFNNITFEDAMEWNRLKKDIVSYNKIYIILKKSKYMVIDFDDALNFEARFQKYGGENYLTKSSNRKLPHLWRLKEDDDYSKNITKVNGEEVDFIYTYICERRDAKMICYDQTGANMPTFDFKTLHPKPISKKMLEEKQNAPQPVRSAPNTTNNDHHNRLLSHLMNHSRADIGSYSVWLKMGFACKSVFTPDLWFEIFKAYSQMSSSADHCPDYVDYDAWEKMFEGEPQCGIPTILEYSKTNNEEVFNKIETDYREGERKKAMKEGKACLLKSLSEPPEMPEEAADFLDEMYGGEEDDKPSYAVKKAEFETKHSKITSLGLYVTLNADGSSHFKETSKFKEGYRHYKYYDRMINPKTGAVRFIQRPFLPEWLDDENIKTYDFVGVYPPPLVAPPRTLNMWSPFVAATHEGEYVKNLEALEMFKKHILILCNNEQHVADYFIHWLAQMFQFPAVKTRAITLISKEGAGKGRLLDLISLLMGDRKIFETAEPSNNVWGKFNGRMNDCFLVNLNEMCMKEADGAEGQIKRLITDKRLDINKKGIDSFPIDSYHRFLVTSNNEMPMKSKKDDRRNFIVRSSDELIGKFQYFKDFTAMMDDLDSRRTIYDYLMSIEGLEDFGLVVPPMTEHQEEIQEQMRDNYDRWLENFTFVHRNSKEPILKYTATDLCAIFVKWTAKNGIKFETSSIKFAIALKRLGINGVDKGRSNGTNYTAFNIEALKIHYNIKSGCLLDLGLDGIKGLKDDTETSNYNDDE